VQLYYPFRISLESSTVIRITLICALLLANVGRGLAQSTEPRLEWAHTLEDIGEVILTTWSPTNKCVAVATATMVHVIDISGYVLWRWNLSETNRLIRVAPLGGSLALSPTCDTVILGGRTDYKYVWAAEQNGRRTFFGTSGTPLSVKFSLQGDSVAIVTGARLGYLMSPRLALRWRGALGDLPVRWPYQTPDQTAGRGQGVFTREDVDALFGAMMWGWAEFDRVSDDGSWRVVTHGQERGRRTTSIELWGPGAGGYRGRHRVTNGPSQPRWVKAMGCPYGELTHDGAFVVATGDPAHPDAWLLGDSPDCDSGNLSTYVFDRDGNLVLTWPPQTDREEMAAAFWVRTGVPLLIDAGPQWDVALTPEEIASLPDTRRRLTYSPHKRMLLVSRDREVRLYRALE